MNKVQTKPFIKVSAILLIIFSLGNIMAVLDTTGVGIAIPHIAKTYGSTIVNTNWVINTYTLALGSFLMIAGSLTHKFGAKNILIIGMVVFTIASLISGLSSNLSFLIGARFIQGIGAALFMPANLALLYTSYQEEKQRARMLGIWSAIIAIATGTGSLIGGAIISFFGWQSIFILNVPIGLFTICSVMLMIKNNKREEKTKISIFNHLLLILTLTTLIVYLIQGQQYGWLKTPWIYLLFILIILIILLIMNESKSEYPIVPRDLIKNKYFLVANLFGLFVNISLYSIVIVLTLGLYLQNALHLSATKAGAAILPGMILLVAGSIYYSKAVRTNTPNQLIKGAIFLALIASISIITVLLFTNNPPIWLLMTIFSIIGFGVGVLTPASTTILMSSACDKYISSASATLNANKQIGGLFGTVVVSLILLQFGNNWSIVLLAIFFANIVLYFFSFIVALLSLKETE